MLNFGDSAMRIEEIAKVDLSKKWVVFNRDEFEVIEKDPALVRWFKMVFHILTCCCVDVYGHIRIDRIAEKIFQKFEEDFKKDHNKRRHYQRLVDHLLKHPESPIITYRKALSDLQYRLSTYARR